jgi:hypothetical protein
MEAVLSSETLKFYWTAQRNTPERRLFIVTAVRTSNPATQRAAYIRETPDILFRILSLPVCYVK